jgi:hypothetical protein
MIINNDFYSYGKVRGFIYGFKAVEELKLGDEVTVVSILNLFDAVIETEEELEEVRRSWAQDMEKAERGQGQFKAAADAIYHWADGDNWKIAIALEKLDAGVEDGIEEALQSL